MKYVIFDTETTGFTNKDEVIQFSGVVTDESFNPIEFFDFYCDTARKCHPDAFAVHHLTQDVIHKKSRGMTLEDHLAGLTWIKEPDLVWVGYNVGFDIRLTTNTLRNNGASIVNFGSETETLDKTSGIWHYDLMKTVTKQFNRKMTLVNALKKIGMGDRQLINVYRHYTKRSIDGAQFHLADFDATSSWVLLTLMRTEYGLQ